MFLVFYVFKGSLPHRWSPGDYRISPLPPEYRCPLPVPSLAVSLARPAVYCRISPRTCQAGYGRFRPNNRGHHLGLGYYRLPWLVSVGYQPWRLAPVLPTPYSRSFFQTAKAHAEHGHSGFPRRAFAHCEVFAPAAARRPWIPVSGSISGLPLPWPVPVIGLWGRYPHNNLIGRSPILGRQAGKPPTLWVMGHSSTHHL